MKPRSAFTPILQKPIAVKQSPLNLFEPSPIQKFLYLKALAQHQAQSFKKVFSPMKVVTPSQFLNIGGTQQVTPGLLRQYSECSITQQFLINAPRGFNYDVIIPNNSMIGNSPLRETSLNDNSGFSSDQDKDLESTEESQIKPDEEMTEFSSENQKKPKSFNINGIIIENFLASDDLNECVDFLLRKQKININQSIHKIIRHNASGKSKEKRRRYRKNCDQHHILLKYFEKNPNWDKQMIQKFSDELGLKESQIYKWNWDQRKKSMMDD